VRGASGNRRPYRERVGRTEQLLREDAGRRDGPGAFRVLTTGDPRKVAPVVGRLWGTDVPVAPIEV